MSGSLFDDLGGAEGVRRLVERFYDVMDESPQARTIRGLHEDDLSEAREKLYLFLSGWTGGPSLYVEKYGHPRLRSRHLPFPIGTPERDQWLACMRRSLEEVGVPELLREQLMGSFSQVADFMRNRDLQGP